MTIEGIIAIDKQLLTIFNGSNSMYLDSLVPILTSGMTWIPLYIGLLYLVVKNNENMGQIGLIIGATLACLLLSGGIDDAIIKPLISRLRPCNDPTIKYQLNIVAGTIEQSYSFFSAHAANTMSLAVFFCLLVRDKLFNGFMLLWSFLNCWTRLYLGVHYPFDVLAGIVWGCMIAVLVYIIFYKIYYKFNPRLNYISTQYSSTGYDRSDIDVVVAIFVITIAVAVVGAFINI